MKEKVTYGYWISNHGYCPKCWRNFGDIYKTSHKPQDKETIKEFIKHYDYATICNNCGWIGRFPWTISKQHTISKKINKIIKNNNKEMNYKKALFEIKKLQDDGIFFKYDFNHNVINKFMFCIEKEGYSIKDIVSKLKQNEKLLIMVNDGYTWNQKGGKDSKMLFNKQYENSIYWEHSKGDCVRVGSDQGSIIEWSNELEKIFSV